jgi:cytochrome c peroxidase
MSFRHRMAQLALVLLLIAGCARAQKFPGLSPKPAETAPPHKPVVPGIPPSDGWLEEIPPLDIPIRFIAEGTDERDRAAWNALPQFWNEFPGPAGIFTASVGLDPREAAVALTLQVRASVIHIKVPRGLPDPTPLIPPTNPPTYAKWVLGKKMFFDDKLLTVAPLATRSCASCHDPQQGFTLHVNVPPDARFNAPSLINCVYNRHQFWDGRVTALEEVLLRKLEDEQPLTKDVPPDKSPGYQHVWPGLVARLSRPDYDDAFKRVFGRPATADSAARALATYMRTILSGNSLYDRAEFFKRERSKDKGEGKELKAEDIQLSLPRSQRAASTQTALKLFRGYELFMSAGRCVKCHPAPLFTDHGFHNISIGESAGAVIPGREPGRFAVVPYGLKHKNLIGAFKTPTLRSLLVTQPYMHDGSLATLKDVLNHYRTAIRARYNQFLDPVLSDLLLEPERPGYLDEQDVDRLELFLEALQGDEVDPIVSVPWRK